MLTVFLLVVLSLSGGESLSPNKGIDRRQAVQSTVGAATSSGLLLPPFATAADETRVKSTISPIATLSDGTLFPLASFGLQVYDDNTAYKLTATALQVGYRNFFASVLAGNQRGFSRAVRDSGLPRTDLFICGSVVSNRAVGYDAAKKATTKGWNQNMEAFAAGNIDYLDQIMLDYPGPDCDSIRGQWASFEEMVAQKLTKTLAVSNFSPVQLDCVLTKDFTMKPVVNQLPYSVAYHAPNVIADNAQRNILVQAWAPLGGSLGGRFSAQKKEVCARIGANHGNKTFAQVALRWILQTGAAFTTQSENKDHFKQDLDIFDFELTPEEMETLNALAA